MFYLVNILLCLALIVNSHSLCLSSSPPPSAVLQSIISGRSRVPTSSSCQHYNLQRFPHIFQVMDRRHDCDAWPHPCARFRALEPCARSVPNPCAVLADQTTCILHSHRSRHTCGHFLLPIRAIVACAHLRLQPIRYILPHDIQEKRKHSSHSTIDVQRKLIGVRIKACSHSRAGSIGGKHPLMSHSTAPQIRQSVFVSRFKAKGQINSKSSNHI